jgi:colanic acid biosynthesis glycosyl transferase WcaI
MKQSPKIIWIITPYYPPDGGPSAPTFLGIAEELAAHGYQVEIITAFPHYKSSVGHTYKGKWFVSERQGNISIHRGFVYAGNISSIGKRMLNYLSMDLSASISAFRHTKPNLILTHTPILMIGLPALLMKKFRRVPFLYYVYDLFPDVVVHAGAVKQGWLSRLLAMQERWAYRSSTRIVTMQESQKEVLVKRGVPDGKISTIPIYVDIDFIFPIGKETTVRKNMKLEDKIIVSYIGVFGFAQSLETILLAAQILQSRSNMHFLIVGDGSKKDALLQMKAVRKLDNVTFLEYQPREKMPELFATSDISLIPLKRGVSLYTTPSKTLSIMASGRPLIATVEEESDLGKVIQQTGAGLVVPPENANALAEAIVQLADSPEKREKMGKAGRSYVETYLSRPKVMSQWIELVKEIISESAK